MQDLNNENTVPFQPGDEPGDTVPNRVPRDPEPTGPVPDPGQTRPTNVAAPAERSASANSPTVATMPNDNLPQPPRPPRRRRWPWVLAGILLVILFVLLGGWLGYRNAVQARKAEMDAQVVQTATEHFMLGVKAQANKQYQVAQAQFDYVLRIDPNFPGAQDKLREVLVAMSLKATPTLAPTIAPPTPTPTKDTRPQEEIYNQARQQYAAQDWDGLFATIDSLRQIDPKFHAVQVDDMLYVALRYRGVDKILHKADLEGGLYDLALAEQFGPLDQDAKGYRNWARLYLNGASFWEADWKKVMEAFQDIYPSFPNMTDSSGITAIQRYRIAAKSYADQLVASGDYCGAGEYYDKSLKAVPDNAVAATATAVAGLCSPATATPQPTVPATVTPSLEATLPIAPTATTAAAPTTAPTVETPQPPAATPTTAAPAETTPANP